MAESKAAPAGRDTAGAEGWLGSSEKSDKEMCPALSEIPPRLGDGMQKKRAAFGNAERYSHDAIAGQRYSSRSARKRAGPRCGTTANAILNVSAAPAQNVNY